MNKTTTSIPGRELPYSRSHVKAVRGSMSVPGDKSISHRAIMFSSLANKDTIIEHCLESDDCLATMDCFARLGVSIEQDPNQKGRFIVHGRGLHGLHPSSDPVSLDTRNSGTTTRILAGILSPQHFTSIVSGDSSLNKRPMLRIMDPLTRMGASIKSLENNNCCPLQIEGKPLKGITYRTKVASAQVKSSILCAGLYADTTTTVIEPSLSRDHTERMLSSFGVTVKSYEESDTKGNITGHCAAVNPIDELQSPGTILVPGDISSAAYFIAAATLVPSSEVLITNVGINPTRDGIIKAAKMMGADITVIPKNKNPKEEPIADLLVRSSSLHGITIEKEMIPTLIDELPVIAVMASVADGTTIIKDAAELKVKESNRIAAMAEGLLAMGADVTPTDDGMIIKGGSPLHGASIRTYKDHRVAMSFAIASLIADGTTTLDDPSCVDISYPDFFADLNSLIQTQP